MAKFWKSADKILESGEQGADFKFPSNSRGKFLRRSRNCHGYV